MRLVAIASAFALQGCCAAGALAQFDAAMIFANLGGSVTAIDGANFEQDQAGGPFFDFYVSGLNQSIAPSITLPSASAGVDSSIDVALTPTLLTCDAAIEVDVQADGSGASATATSEAVLEVTFVVSAQTQWSFPAGVFSVSNANAKVMLDRLEPAPQGAPVFVFEAPADHAFAGQNGLIDPGTYIFSLTLSAYRADGAIENAGASMGSANFQFLLSAPPPTACPGDANRDGFVNFADITSVLTNFGVNYSPASGVGDANFDGIVNFADITSVLTNFGVVCP